MDDAPRPVPPELKAALDRSRDDLAAGRTRPLAPVLAALRRRAVRRMAQHRDASSENERTGTDRA